MAIPFLLYDIKNKPPAMQVDPSFENYPFLDVKKITKKIKYRTYINE